MKKNVIIIFIVISMFLCGCTGEEIDTLAMVTGTAFEKSENGISMTCCLLKANGKFGAEGENGENTMIVTADGKTVADCQQTLTLKTERRPFFGHNNIVVMDKNAPIEDILFSFYEEKEKRGAEKVIITDKNAAASMEAKNFMGSVGGVSLDEVLKISEKNGNIFPVSVHDIISGSFSKGRCALVPFGKTQGEAFNLETMCILKDFKFVKTLDGSALLGANILLKRNINTLFSLETKNGIADMKIDDVSTNIRHENGCFFIKINCNTTITDLRRRFSNENIKKCASEYIEKVVKDTISLSKSLNADFCGFEEMYYRRTGMDNKTIKDFDFKTEVTVNIFGEE